MRDGKNIAVHIKNRLVHDAGVIVENAQTDDLVNKPVAIVVRIAVGHSDEDERARADRAGHVAVDSDARLADALDKRAHPSI